MTATVRRGLGTDELLDLELVLLGLLPRNHVLGGDGRTGPAGLGSIESRDHADSPDADTHVLLVDAESTPLASLHEPRVADGLLSGRLEPGRVRESGVDAARRLGAADLRESWDAVLVLARPLRDDEQLPDGRLLVLVPEDPRATGGVPAAVLMRLAERRLGGRPGSRVLAAPLRARPGSTPSVSGTATEALAQQTGATVQVFDAAHDRFDPSDPTHVAGLGEQDRATLLRWRPARAHRGVVLLFSGLSGSGKSTVARAVHHRITHESARTVTMLDGDVVRTLLSSGLGFDRESRLTNLRRIGWVAAEVARHGGIAIAAPIAPYQSIRDEMRAMAQETGDFFLVHVNTPIEECERRDLKGLYAHARAGRIPEFTGISDPYEEPLDADLRVDTSQLSVEEAAEQVFDALVTGGWLRPEAGA